MSIPLNKLENKHVKVTHSCPTLCNPMDYSVQFSRSVVSDSTTTWIVARQAFLSITNSQSLLELMPIKSDYIVHGILQARLLEWVAFPFSGKINTTTNNKKDTVNTHIYTHKGRKTFSVECFHKKSYNSWMSLYWENFWKWSWIDTFSSNQ